MTSIEIAVSIGGALLGYWIISSWLNSKSDPSKPATPLHEEKNSFREADQQRGSQDERGREPQHPLENEAIGENWFRILAVSETARMDEIAAAYRQLIRQYHPDKVASLGPELQELAELKSKQINAAYDYATKLRS